MKDYSEFIKVPEGFIISIKPILETKTIEVLTSMSKKNQPHVYTLTKEELERLYTRLEKQYKLLIENKNSILNKEEAKREKKSITAVIISAVITIALLLTAFIAPGLNFLFIAGLLPVVGTVTGTLVAKSNYRKKFNSMIETYNYFITNKEEIEALAKIDENVTSEITMNSYKKLKASEQLVEEKLADEQYTIGLIDNLSLKDLKEISLRYKISKALDSEPYFEIEHLEEIIGEPVNEENINEENANEEITWEEIENLFSEDQEYDLPELDENNEEKNQHYSKKLHK